MRREKSDAEYPAKRDPKRPPMHPGKLLREDVLPAIGRPKTEIARLLGISRKTLYDILDEKQPVTPAMALRIGTLCGNGPMLWLNLQLRYGHLAGCADNRTERHSNAEGGLSLSTGPLQKSV